MRAHDALSIVLAAWLLPATHAAYACTSLGTECTTANRIYSAGVYQNKATLEAACDANDDCIQFDWSASDNVGFQCSSTATRDDDYDEYVV